MISNYYHGPSTQQFLKILEYLKANPNDCRTYLLKSQYHSFRELAKTWLGKWIYGFMKDHVWTLRAVKKWQNLT